MQLLEREAQLRELNALLNKATSQSGQIVLISGEAWSGKTALIDKFLRTYDRHVDILSARCHSLIHPMARGLLGEIASQVEITPADRSLLEMDWLDAANALLSHMERKATVLVIDDLHQADENSLDLIGFIGRRINRTKALLVLAFREDELPAWHPLQMLLGDLVSTNAIAHITTPGLSIAAVRQLIGDRAVDPESLHYLTGGNPFFITEMLQAEQGCIPPLVRKAVLARAARLSPGARTVLEAAAILSDPVEPWLLLNMLMVEPETIDACLSSGLLQTDGDRLRFRQPLAREIILETVSPARTIQLHRRAYEVLSTAALTSSDDARLSLHAQAGADETAVLLHAPAAARKARQMGALREACQHYRRALVYAAGMPPDQKISMLEEYAKCCQMIGENEAAIQGYAEAAELRQNAHQWVEAGRDLSLKAESLVRIWRVDEALGTNLSAIRLLEQETHSKELAWAYGLHSGLHTVRRDMPEAVSWGDKARSVAEKTADAKLISTNYIGLGSALMLSGDQRGRDYLQRSIDIAKSQDQDEVAALGMTNLVASAGETFQFQLAESWLDEALAFCVEREFGYYHARLLAWSGISHFYRGRWTKALKTADQILQLSAGNAARLEALVITARVSTRRGEPVETTLLDEALELAQQTGALQDLAPVRIARAEAAMLTKNMESAAKEAGAGLPLALERKHPWFAGELSVLARQAGMVCSVPSWLAAPYYFSLSGQWIAAANAWQALGCPFEQATALAEGGPEDKFVALGLFDHLGAALAAQAVRRRLRSDGIRKIPRGPMRKTRANSFGLTPRQMEVLRLIAEGLSNSQIAARLLISQRTAEHHVAAVLSRLDVKTRIEAMRVLHDQET